MRSLAKQLQLTLRRKTISLSRNMTNKACQVNFDEINNENCYRSGCQALQNKKMAEEIKFLNEQINEKKNIIRSLFSLKPRRFK